MSELLLTLDAGTGSVRAVVFDTGGAVRSSASRGWSAHAPPELAPFGREFDADALVEALFAAAREALSEVDARQVKAIACTGQRIACAFVDAEGRTLYVGPNGDVRALAGAALDDLDPEALYRTTGRFPPWIQAPARLRWFATGAPEIFARVHRVLGIPDWVGFLLTGEAATDATTAADLSMLDVASRARAVVGTPGLDDAAWPVIRESGALLGPVTGEVARALGLRDDTPVAIGGADTQLALLGCGVLERGTAVVAGTSAPLVRVTDAPVRDPKGRMWTDPHVAADRWLLEANLGEMGAIHAWTLDNFCVDLAALDDPFGAYDALARSAPIGCRGASSHLGPRAMDLRNLNTGRPAALLMPFGQTSVQRPPGRAELLRATLESCAFAVRAGREWLDAVVDDDGGPLLVAGGMSRSAFFCDVLASVLRREVIGAHPDASSRGAAMCAAVVAGLAASPEAAVPLLRASGRAHAPVEDDAEPYDDAYERWIEREQQLEEL